MSPAVRFRVLNKSPEPIRSIQATATFRREGEEENWGSAWEQVLRSRSRSRPARSVLVVLRSDGHYTSSGAAGLHVRACAVQGHERRGLPPGGLLGLGEDRREIDIERRVGLEGPVEPLAAP